MDDFASYGRIAPGAIEYRYTNPTQDLEQQGMQMELQHVDRMIQARDEKRQKIDQLGQEISQAYQTNKSSTFIADMDLLNQDFMESVKGIADHYRTPSNQRDVAWHSQLNNLKTSMVSDKIINDQKNQKLYSQVQELQLQDRLSKESFEEWDRGFQEYASKGEDFLTQARKVNESGGNILELPVLSNESFIQKGTQLINNFGDYSMNDLKSNGLGGYVLKRGAIERFVDTTGRGLLDDAKKSFYNLPSSVKQLYKADWNESEATQNKAIREYMIQSLTHSFKPIQFERGTPGGGDRERRNYYEDNVKGAHIEAMIKNFKKNINYGVDIEDLLSGMNDPSNLDGSINPVKKSIPNVLAFLDKTPTSHNTRVLLPFNLPGGGSIDIEVPLSRMIQSEWGFGKDVTGSYPTQIIPTNKPTSFDVDGTPLDSPYGMVIDDVPLSMNKTNLETLIQNLDGEKVSKYFKGEKLQEAFGFDADDTIEVSSTHITFGNQSLEISSYMELFFIDDEVIDNLKEVSFAEGVKPMRRVVSKFNLRSRAIVLDGQSKEQQYNLSFGGVKGFGSAATNIDLNQPQYPQY